MILNNIIKKIIYIFMVHFYVSVILFSVKIKFFLVWWVLNRLDLSLVNILKRCLLGYRYLFNLLSP
jgi:hypothetical protein